MKFIGIIPARYASTRFPGKPLVNIDGKTMIQRVYEQAKKSTFLSEVVVATDDARIAEHVKSFNGNVVMTSTSHRSGTDRCFEAIEKFNKNQWGIVVNIQGDEPFIYPSQIDLVCSCFNSSDVQIATLAKQIKEVDDLLNVNTPKVIFNKKNEAIYFSRTSIPYYRGELPSSFLNFHSYFKHIGIYAYRTEVLKEIVQLPPSSLEIAESLEQLRWIENGYTINLAFTEMESVAIDVPEDLLKLKRV